MNFEHKIASPAKQPKCILRLHMHSYDNNIVLSSQPGEALPLEGGSGMCRSHE